MPLADFQITNLCEAAGMVTPFDPSLVNPASLDVRLGDVIKIENAGRGERFVECNLKTAGYSEADPFMLKPGQFILAKTVETFRLPSDICAQFILKSSRAREGINHLLAGFCDPGWHNSVLTMEIKNACQYHFQSIWPGMRIGQMIFEEMSATPRRDYSKTGRYNGDATVTESKG